MDEELTTAAKTLARWCYARGVDERVLGCGEKLLKAAVEQALGRPAPAHLEQALWQRTAALLGQRRDWDRAHQVSGRAPAKCLLCALARDRCPEHTRRRCRVCAGPLHRIVVEEGFETHPCCDRPGENGSLVVLERTAQLLGATLLAQPV